MRRTTPSYVRVTDRDAKAEKTKFLNKKNVMILIAAAVLVAVIGAVLFLLLREKPHYGKQTPYGFVDKNTGIEYVQCNPLSVKPLKLELEKAYCDDGGTLYYTIDRQDPEEFVADFYAPTGSSIVFRRKDLPELTVEQFDAIAAFLYIDGKTPVLAGTLYADDEYLAEELRGENPSQDTDKVREITKALSEGQHIAVPDSEVDMDSLRYFRLLSEKYPGLYYSVCFFRDLSGRCYLQDFGTNKMVECPPLITVWVIGD